MYIAISRTDIWGERPAFAHPSSSQGDRPASPNRNTRSRRKLTLSPDRPELRVTSRTNFADLDLGTQPDCSMMACSQIDYYRSGTTIATVAPFNQAATIRADFFRPNLNNPTDLTCPQT
jgi:hypothetical protein